MNKDKNQKIEEIISSIDGIRRAETSDFFYTRLKARMEKETPEVIHKSHVLRPAYILTMLLLVFIVNVAVIFSGKTNTSSLTGPNSETDFLLSIAAEYNPADVNGFYDLNDNK